MNIKNCPEMAILERPAMLSHAIKVERRILSKIASLKRLAQTIRTRGGLKVKS
jgi:hypothetical protein